MIERKSLGLVPARKALDAVLQEAARDQKSPIAVAVTDERGDLVAFARMDKVNPVSIRIAFRKAYTSAIHRTDSGAWADKIKQQGRVVSDYGDPELIPFQGGLVIREGGDVIGAIGVSGRTSQEDEELARGGLRAAGLAG
jgi:glc operon protein GlcG